LEKVPHIAPLVLTLLLTQAAGILLLVYFPLTWKTNDDLYMAAITKGYFSNAYSAHLVFINSSIGHLVRLINWLLNTNHGYAILLNQLNALSVSMVSYALLAYRVNIFRVLFVVAALHLFLLNTSIDLQFTVIAGQLAVGVWLFLFIIFDAPKSHPLLITSLLVCLFFAAGLRFDAFLLVSLVFFPAALPKLIRNKWRHVRLYLAMIILAVGLLLFNALHYRTEEWQTFSALYKARTLVIDAPMISATEYDTKLLSPIFDHEEYQLIMGAFFEINDKFNAHQLAEFSKLLKDRYYQHVRLHTVDSKFITFFFTLLFTALLCYWLSKKRYFLLVCVGLLMATLALAYISTYRVIPDRVIITVLIAGLFMILFEYDETTNITTKRAKPIAWLILGILLVLLGYRLNQRAMRNNTAIQAKRVFAFALQSEIAPYAAYHCGIIATPYVQEYLQMDAIINRNSFWLAPNQQLIPFGWLTYSPIQFEVLDAFGLKKENTFESAADKNNVFIASDLNNKAFQNYLKNRYPQIRVDTLTINQHHNFCLLKLRSN
jgi:hypothetical protein